MSVDEPNKVNIDELEFDEDLALLNGVAFTGSVLSYYDKENLEFEYSYSDGLPQGLQREWYSNGSIKSEAEAIRGRGSAWSRNWHQNGVLAEERKYNHLFPVSILKWSSDGTLVLKWLREWSPEGELISETKLEY